MSGSADIVLRHEYCEKCGSKDNKAVYADGHEYCFTPGCGLVKAAEGREVDTEEEFEAPRRAPETAIPFRTSELKGRGLREETLSRFGYFTLVDKGRPLHLAPFYDQSGNMVYQKYRHAKDKEFWWVPLRDEVPRPHECLLFGQQAWGDKFDRMVVVTEGELDAMSVAQATKFKVPAVSIPQGVTSAVKALKANYRWLDRFETIVLWLDNDEPGQAVLPDCASLFEPGKVKVVRHPTAKDASDLLQAGHEGEVYAAVWGATPWSPQGIVNARDCASDMAQEEGEPICSYPYPKLNTMTGGILRGEVVYHVAGTGIGKTSHIVEYQHHLLKHGIKFGVMRFEDTRRKVQLDLMSREIEDRLHLRPRPEAEMVALHSYVFGKGHVEILDPERALWDFDSITGYIRYMAKGLDCEVVFVDPLSFLQAAYKGADERKALDEVAFQFSRMVKQLGFNLQVSHHLNREDGKSFEEGAQISLKNIRGSGGVANFSMSVIGYERNQQGPRPDLTRVRVLKCRHTGTTGVADIIKWDELRGFNEPTTEPWPEDGDSPGFGPAPSNGDPSGY